MLHARLQSPTTLISDESKGGLKMTIAAKQRRVNRANRDLVPSAPAAPAPPATEEAPPSHDKIATRAYEIWQRHGCPDGTAFRDWLAAEAELRCHR